MTKPKQKIFRTIKKSCITGNAVWLGTSMTRDTTRRAYKRACQREIERMKQWNSIVERRRESILRFLNGLLASMPIIGELPPEKKAAAKVLTKIADTPPPLYRDFYDHIIEERRRQDEDKEIRRKMRERENQSNTNYDK